MACELTTAAADLLGQIYTPFDTFIADGAYDGEPVSQTILSQQPDAQVVILPHKTAVISTTGDSQKDKHIRVIDQYGRIAWQKKDRLWLVRNYAELAVQRYKHIFGNTMKARKLPQQNAEAWASAVALNWMTGSQGCLCL